MPVHRIKRKPRVHASKNTKKEIVKISKNIFNHMVKYKYYTGFDNTTETINGLPYQTTGVSMYGLTLIPQSIGEGGRDGMQIKVHSITFSYYVANNLGSGSVVGNVNNVCRMIAFIDNGTKNIPLVGDLLGPQGSGIATTDTSPNWLLANLNEENCGGPSDRKKRRFKVLWNRQFTIGNNGGTLTNRLIKKTFVWKNPLVVNYLDTTVNASSIGSGQIWLMYSFGQSTTMTNNPFFSGAVRVQYVDM